MTLTAGGTNIEIVRLSYQRTTSVQIQSYGGEGTIEAIGSGRARLPLLDPGELSEPQLELYTKLLSGPRADNGSAIASAGSALPGPFNAMLFNPVLGDAVQGVGVAIRFHTGLSERVRELAILAVAAAARCGYEWAAHTVLARRAGLDDAQIDAVWDGRPVPRLSAEETLVVGFINALATAGDAGDGQLNEFVAALGFAASVELIFLVGYYQMLARSLRVWRVDTPPDALTPTASSADEATGS